MVVWLTTGAPPHHIVWKPRNKWWLPATAATRSPIVADSVYAGMDGVLAKIGPALGWVRTERSPGKRLDGGALVQGRGQVAWLLQGAVLRRDRGTGLQGDSGLSREGGLEPNVDGQQWIWVVVVLVWAALVASVMFFGRQRPSKRGGERHSSKHRELDGVPSEIDDRRR